MKALFSKALLIVSAVLVLGLSACSDTCPDCEPIREEMEQLMRDTNEVASQAFEDAFDKTLEEGIANHPAVKEAKASLETAKASERAAFEKAREWFQSVAADTQAAVDEFDQQVGDTFPVIPGVPDGAYPDLEALSEAQKAVREAERLLEEAVKKAEADPAVLEAAAEAGEVARDAVLDANRPIIRKLKNDYENCLEERKKCQARIMPVDETRELNIPGGSSEPMYEECTEEDKNKCCFIYEEGHCPNIPITYIKCTDGWEEPSPPC